MWIGIITLFPNMFRAITDYGVVGRAIQRGLLSIKFWNPREFSNNRHHNVDGYLYGGGAGMLMMVQPLRDAISCAKFEAGPGNNVKVIYLSPQGRKFDQNSVNELLADSKLILVCGRYKGIDERLLLSEIDEEWSIGDYILSGGELPAMVLIDAVSRFIPGVLNHLLSAEGDTFFNSRRGILDAPNYTRPSIFEGMSVPRVLLSGNHNEISRWRLKESLGRTWIKRPELLREDILTDEERKLLFEFKYEFLTKLIHELS